MPLCVDPGGHHKFVALRYLLASLGVAGGLLAAYRCRWLSLSSPVAACWAAVVGVNAVATAASPDPLFAALGDTTRMFGLATVALLAAAFVLGAATGDHGGRVATHAVLAGGAVAIVVGLAQLVGVVHHSGRLTATMGNAGFLGGYLCIVLPIAATTALLDRASRRWSVPLIAGGAVVLIGSGTRGAWIGAAIGIGVAVALARGGRRSAGALGAAVLIVVVVAVFAPVGGRGEPGSPGTARGRVDTWRVAARVIARRPILGWGPEGLRNGFAREMDPQWTRAYGLRQLPDRAHNRFLDVAATTGVVGLVADVALIAVALRALYRRRAAAVTGAFVAWLVQGQFLFDTFDLSLVMWLLVGAALASEVEAAVTTTRRRAGAAVPLIGAVVVATAVVGFVADRKLEESSGRAPLDAYARLRDVVDLRPRSLDASLLLGTAARASEDPDALLAAHTTLAKWNDDEIQLADARVLNALGDASQDPRRFRQAATILERVGRHRPSDGRVWAALAIVRANQGDAAEAARLAAKAESLSPHRVATPHVMLVP